MGVQDRADKTRQYNHRLNHIYPSGIIPLGRTAAWAKAHPTKLSTALRLLDAIFRRGLEHASGRVELADAKTISKVGWKVGVWGWYLTDNEIQPSMHVCTNVPGRALGKLPSEADKLVMEITIPNGFKPAFPMVISPKELAGELVAQTESLVELYEFQIAVYKVKQMQKEGAAQDKIKAAIENLPKVKAPTEWLTNIDYVSYLKKLKEL